jgi:gas vesicle protein
MDRIYQRSLFSVSLQLSVPIGENSRYRVLSNVLPWEELAGIANLYRSKKVNITLGRELDLRIHLGAYVSQTMNGWTDRATEEMIRYHAGVRILCGLEESNDTLDRTSIQSFRLHLGKDGSEALNQVIVHHAAAAGFTGSELCAADTTVQEAPIAYPTEAGHMKKMAEKLTGIGKILGSKIGEVVKNLGKKAQEIYTELRLFTRGKKEQALDLKKKLSEELHKTVSKMNAKIKSGLEGSKEKTQKEHLPTVNQYQTMLDQIIVWLKTGKHPVNKLISLWELNARAIAKEKTGKAVEFGRRWIITRLIGGYVIGTPCIKLGSDSDTNIAEEVMINFLNVFGELPENFVYDRGGDGPKNHELLTNLGVPNNCIFRKGNAKMDVKDSVFEMARSERALNEASIATLKSNKYNFTKPRARSMDSCILKGHTSMLGFNINNLFKDVAQTWDMKMEIT